MSFDKGFNFRATSGFVTDGATDTYVLGTDSYPTTRNGVTFGWNAGVNTADRNAANDARLAGINFSSGGGYEFRVDLPATGDYVIHLGVGDDSGGGTGSQTVDVKDNTTTKFSLTSRTYSTAHQFYDAGDNALTNATWPGSEVGVTATFASTTFKLAIGSSGFWVIAHVFISQVVAAGGQPTMRRWGGVPHLGSAKTPGGVRGGPWNRVDDGLVIPRWLADERRAA